MLRVFSCISMLEYEMHFQKTTNCARCFKMFEFVLMVELGIKYILVINLTITQVYTCTIRTTIRLATQPRLARGYCKARGG